MGGNVKQFLKAKPHNKISNYLAPMDKIILIEQWKDVRNISPQ